jgi:hypothetical protein
VIALHLAHLAKPLVEALIGGVSVRALLGIGIDIERARALDPEEVAGVLPTGEARAIDPADADPTVALCVREAAMKAIVESRAAGAQQAATVDAGDLDLLDLDVRVGEHTDDLIVGHPELPSSLATVRWQRRNGWIAAAAVVHAPSG